MNDIEIGIETPIPHFILKAIKFENGEALSDWGVHSINYGNDYLELYVGQGKMVRIEVNIRSLYDIALYNDSDEIIRRVRDKYFTEIVTSINEILG